MRSEDRSRCGSLKILPSKPVFKQIASLVRRKPLPQKEKLKLMRLAERKRQFSLVGKQSKVGIV